MMLGEGSSATVGCSPSGHGASQDKHLAFRPCHAYLACAKLVAAVVAAAAGGGMRTRGAATVTGVPAVPHLLLSLTAGAANMS